VVQATRHARVGALKSCGPLSEDLNSPDNPVLFRGDNQRPSLQRNLAPGTEFLRPETKRLNRPFSLPSDRVAHIVRHTTPANAAFSREVSESAKFREWVVVCAVKYEPVSTHKFPIIREFNREFGPFSPLSASPEMKFQNKVKYLCRNSLCNIIGNYEQLIGNSKNRNGF
jgi:hypothetical protein